MQLVHPHARVWRPSKSSSSGSWLCSFHCYETFPEALCVCSLENTLTISCPSGSVPSHASDGALGTPSLDIWWCLCCGSLGRMAHKFIFRFLSNKRLFLSSGVVMEVPAGGCNHMPRQQIQRCWVAVAAFSFWWMEHHQRQKREAERPYRLLKY